MDGLGKQFPRCVFGIDLLLNTAAPSLSDDLRAYRVYSGPIGLKVGLIELGFRA